jgi:O-acetyl-ADP-ribose deacetylase
MPLQLIRQDISKVNADVIVNAANASLEPGGGVCGAIFEAAGFNQLRQACLAIGHCEVGQTVVTPAFSLSAKYIFHTVGPKWQGGNQGEYELLRQCYETALTLAIQYNCESIAFPLIASGQYGFPKEQAFMIANEVCQHFLADHELHIYLVLFDEQTLTKINQHTAEIQKYIDENYVQEIKEKPFNKGRFELLRQEEENRYVYAEEVTQLRSSQLSEAIQLDRLEDTFTEKLFSLIDEKNLSDVDVYKKANLSRKHFSKIRSNIHYQPSKHTAIALAISLELTIHETLDLLKCAGYTLSNSKKFDVIIQHFIERRNYSIFEINEALFDFGEPILI